jgi:CheY-like chemotaxis protein
VQVVENGVECLRALEEKEFGVVLMDCQMPVMDGFQATQRIRELEKSRQEKKRERQAPPDVRPWVSANDEPEPPPMPIIALTASATKVPISRNIQSSPAETYDTVMRLSRSTGSSVSRWACRTCCSSR